MRGAQCRGNKFLIPHSVKSHDVMYVAKVSTHKDARGICMLRAVRMSLCNYFTGKDASPAKLTDSSVRPST